MWCCYAGITDKQLLDRIDESLSTFYGDDRLCENFYIDNEAGRISRSVTYKGDSVREGNAQPFDKIVDSLYFDGRPVKVGNAVLTKSPGDDYLYFLQSVGIGLVKCNCLKGIVVNTVFILKEATVVKCYNSIGCQHANVGTVNVRIRCHHAMTL